MTISTIILPHTNKLSEKTQLTVKRDILTIEYGGGKQQAVANGLSSIRHTWRFLFTGLTTAEANDILTAINQVYSPNNGLSSSSAVASNVLYWAPPFTLSSNDIFKHWYVSTEPVITNINAANTYWQIDFEIISAFI